MKITINELMTALDPSGPAALLPGEPSRIPTAPTNVEGKRTEDLRYNKRNLLCAGIKKLGAKHLVPTSTRREQRKNILESIQWLAKKNEFQTKQQTPVGFWHQKAKQEGRLDLAMYGPGDRPILALVVNFTVEPVHLDKLKGALNEGFLPVLVTLKSEKHSIARYVENCKLSAKFAGWLKVVYLDD